MVRGNKLSHNAWNGLVLIDSAGSRIAGNELDDNGNNGTEVNGKSDSTSVTGNGADGNKAIGIVVGSVQNVRVVGNTAKGNDTGLFFFDLHASLIGEEQREGQPDRHPAHGRPVRLRRQPPDGQHRQPQRRVGDHRRR